MDANAQAHKLIIFDARQNSVADTNKVPQKLFLWTVCKESCRSDSPMKVDSCGAAHSGPPRSPALTTWFSHCPSTILSADSESKDPEREWSPRESSKHFSEKIVRPSKVTLITWPIHIWPEALYEWSRLCETRHPAPSEPTSWQGGAVWPSLRCPLSNGKALSGVLSVSHRWLADSAVLLAGLWQSESWPFHEEFQV